MPATDRQHSCITLLTDFGVRDGFVGTMKGVITGINPTARMIDLSHDIPPQDIDAAAFVLAASFQYFSENTIHVVVVDPSVGSDRNIILASAGGYWFLASDNGVLTLALRQAGRARYWRVSNREYFLPDVSRTFHGRDIFAPVAAHLSMGIPPEEIGVPVNTLIRKAYPAPRRVKNGIRGRVQYIDHFGNAITNIEPRHLGLSVKKRRIVIGDAEIVGISQSYAAVASGQLLAIFGSSGFLEIAVNSGSALDILSLEVGTPVTVK